MSTLEPLVNLITLLAALSIAAERLTNVAKGLDPDLLTDVEVPKATDANESKRAMLVQQKRERDSRLTTRAVGHGVLVAIVLKADLFAILRNLEAPWATLGWFQRHGEHLARTATVPDAWTFVLVIVGCLMTGVALGFGSNFWHEILSIVLEFRDKARKAKEEAS